MDNFEWTTALVPASGWCSDFKTQKRTRKLSVMWFKEASARNAVV